MNELQKKSAVTAFAMLSLGVALAGCTPTAAPGDTNEDIDPVTDTDFDGYTDGTYTASGNYIAPSGTETVTVTVTLADGVVTDLEVVGDATDPTAQNRQGQFIAGINDIVVGKSINDLDVHKVGGSSLTSGGFNAAIEDIKAEAAA